jgi:hypothetical protein
MMVEFKLSDIKETKPLELGVRFLFGGICTVGAGLIASATLIQAHEKEKKAQIGSDGTRRGRMSASIDAAGAALGCCGLVTFAMLCWRTLANHNAVAIITACTAVWLLVSIVFWEIRKRRIFGR